MTFRPLRSLVKAAKFAAPIALGVATGGAGAGILAGAGSIGSFLKSDTGKSLLLQGGAALGGRVFAGGAPERGDYVTSSIEDLGSAQDRLGPALDAMIENDFRQFAASLSRSGQQNIREAAAAGLTGSALGTALAPSLSAQGDAILDLITRQGVQRAQNQFNIDNLNRSDLLMRQREEEIAFQDAADKRQSRLDVFGNLADAATSFIYDRGRINSTGFNGDTPATGIGRVFADTSTRFNYPLPEAQLSGASRLSIPAFDIK